MQRQKRPFYIIGHNPNTIEEAKEFLDKGANALGPDIVYANGKFYVSHQQHWSYDGIPTVQEYLKALKDLLTANHYNLALIVWNMKTTDFDCNDFIGLVKENFCGEIFDGVAMLVTHGDDYGFLNRYKGYYPNTGIGVDESNVPAHQLQEIFANAGQRNFAYADGITTFLNKPGVFKNVAEALALRDGTERSRFSFVYTRVLSQETSMRRYLNAHIDAIFVDAGSVFRLKDLLTSEPYSNAYTLSENGYNPFMPVAIPKYRLGIITKNKFLAGTDAHFLFTLTGTNGISLTSLPYNANAGGALERGTITHVAMEGTDVGEIESLTIEAITSGLAAGWLPETIVVESNCLQTHTKFAFNTAGNEEWITKHGGAVTKFPTR